MPSGNAFISIALDMGPVVIFPQPLFHLGLLDRGRLLVGDESGGRFHFELEMTAVTS